MGIFKIENLTYTYPLGEVVALKNVSFSVEEGEFVAVCGATGSGKSTLLKMIKGDDISIGYVMQRPEQQIFRYKGRCRSHWICYAKPRQSARDRQGLA